MRCASDVNVSCIWMSRVSHMKESCVRYGWVATYEWCHIQMRCVSDVKDLEDVPMLRRRSHIHGNVYEWFRRRSHIHVYMDQSCVTYERVVCQIWMSHVSRVNESCLTSLRRTARIESSSWHSHVNTSRHTYEWVVCEIWISRASDMNESPHMNDATYKWDVYQMWMSHAFEISRVSHMKESCVRYGWVATYEWWHIRMRCASDVNVSCIWVSRVSHMKESCVRYGWVMSRV